MILYSYTRW